MKNLFLFVFFLFTIIACTPYDSNKVNTNLLQGKWLKIDKYQIKNDTLAIPATLMDTTSLTFDRKSCSEYIFELKTTSTFNYKIQNYRLFLYRNDTLVNWFSIKSLANDSLVIEQGGIQLKYKKIE